MAAAKKLKNSHISKINKQPDLKPVEQSNQDYFDISTLHRIYWQSSLFNETY